MPAEKSESLPKIVNDVDDCFDTNWFIKIRVVWLRFFFSIVALGTFLLAYYFSQIGAQAAVANVLELSVAIDGLATAIAAFGLVMFGMVLSRDWDESENRKAERMYYRKLKDRGNALTIRALIRMRVRLPKDVRLKDIRAANPELFTEKEFARRLLER